MAKRDMKKTAAKLRKLYEKHGNDYLQNYSLELDEVCELLEMCKTVSCFRAVTTAFDYGFVLGARAHNKKQISAL